MDSGGIEQVKISADSLDESAESEARMARLLRAIEGEIVPRLVLARRAAQTTAAADAGADRRPDDADVTELVRLLLAHDVGVASAYVETVRRRGASLEAVCLSLLAPAARELGLLWEADECDFMQVTVGLCRLHHLLRELSPAFRSESVEPKIQRNILLAPVPGDQHTFGITLVAQFLRKAGGRCGANFRAEATNFWKSSARIGLRRSDCRSAPKRGSTKWPESSRRFAMHRVIARSASWWGPVAGRKAGACRFDGCGRHRRGWADGRGTRGAHV